MIPLLLLALAPSAEPAPWEKDEAAHLANIKQLTTDFVRAGEGYFSPDGTKIIFQAEEKDTGNPFYQIFMQDLTTGKLPPRQPRRRPDDLRLLPPRRQEDHLRQQPPDPDAKKHQAAEYKQREDDRAEGHPPPLLVGLRPHMKIFEADLDGGNLKCLTPDAKVYNAEGSYSADGKQIVFCSGHGGQPGAVHHGRRRHEVAATDQARRTATTAGRSSRPTARRSSSAATARRRTTCSSTSSTPTAPARRR